MQTPTKTSEPIPGYVVKERIGVGGYGEVWSAQAPGDLMKAIKFVYGYFDDKRAARELKALNRIKQVRHPFLLSLERFEIVDGQLIIVTELADMSLKDRFEQIGATDKPGIPRAELLGYMRDAADALDYMRENFALQHLDVKPENMLLVGGRVKVADFGLVKELQDHTASLMGGLTPIYASPEVFDDRPSEHSDQYSLAIVYQEMLTGILPFPGRTPAQLASQHLHARPRLAPLPAADQLVVARALAKDPQQRYASCREMIDSLLAAGSQPSCSTKVMEVRSTVSNAHGDTTTKSPLPTLTPQTNNSTIPRRDVKPKTDPTLPRHEVKPKTDPLLPQREQGTVVLNDGDTSSARPVLPELPPILPVIHLPPASGAPTEPALRPTLYLGIGGTGARALRHLQRTLADHQGSELIPILEMLLLDTDAKSAYQATQGDPAMALADHQVLPLPLRNAQEYTSSSRNILQWLSRRWLYNIPRSLQTEGRRPLGRLALMDHAPQVLNSIRKAIQSISSPEAVGACQATGLTLASPSPRVYIVTSLSGGAGGGMVLDVAYAVRKVLAELGHSDDAVIGILTHATDRNAATHDLGLANTYASLSELNHYCGPNGYPGEAACDLPPFAAGRGPFSTTYFVPLGNDLTDRQFDAATQQLAAYLYLDSATPAGAVIEHCRRLPPVEQTTNASTCLRSFGIIQIGSEQTPLADQTAELVCQETVDRWRGAAKQTWQSDLSATPSPRIELPGSASSAATIEQRAAAHLQGLGLSVTTLNEQARRAVETHLHGDTEAVFNHIRMAFEASGEANGNAVERLSGLLRFIQNEFMPSRDSDLAAHRPASKLLASVEKDLESFVASRAREVREWILSLVDDPTARIGGAYQARQWYAAQIQGFDAQWSDRLHEVQREIRTIEQSLLTTERAGTERPRFFASRSKTERNQAFHQAALLQIVRLRTEEIALFGLSKATRIILAQIVVAADEVKELQRTLSDLSASFAVAAPWGHPTDDIPPSGVSDQVRALVSQSLRIKVQELAMRVDERVQKFLVDHGALRELCKKPDMVRGQLTAALRRAARREVVDALKRVSISSALLGSDRDSESQVARLRQCLESAQPNLADCGGAQRLFAILPENAQGTPLAETLTEKLDPPATVLNSCDADVVFCYELQDLLIPHVANQLLDGRADIVPVAARLHTRTDVTWSPLC